MGEKRRISKTWKNRAQACKEVYLVARRASKYAVYATKNVAKEKKFGCTVSKRLIMESCKLLKANEETIRMLLGKRMLKMTTRICVLALRLKAMLERTL